MVTDNALVRIRELRYSYPGSDHDVLRIPFFDVTGRGLIAVTGPSGSGKSTLVELIAGTLRGEYRGSVEVLGQEWKNLHRDSDRQRHLRRIGLIPQDYGLLTDRSVVDLLLQDLRDAGSGRTNEAERVRAALREVGLEGFEHRQVAALSGGQRQRVAIARMLARDVELVIADEPTANLDPTLTEETVSLFRRLADHVPVLIITHDSQVAAACDRTVVLQSAVSDASPPPPAMAGRSRRRRGRVLTACLVVALIAGGIGAYVLAKGTRQNSAAATGGLRTASHLAARSRAKPTTHSPAGGKVHAAYAPPSFIAGSFDGEDPTTVEFDSDGNNSLVNITWSSWGAEAKGTGYIAEDNCAPSCSDGQLTNVPATITLSEPVNGVYTSMVIASNAGGTSYYTYPTHWAMAANASTTPPTTTPPTTTPAAVPAVLSCNINEAPVTRPTSIVFGCADFGATINNISWTVWTATGGAGGVGTESVDNCVPNCASGISTNFPVNVQLSNPGYVSGAYVFQTISTSPLAGGGQYQSSSDPGSAWGAG